MVVCSFMALPWYVAATVISIAHIDSLKMETETSAPGEQPKFLGVRYVVTGSHGYTSMCQSCGGGHCLGMRQMVVVNHVEVDTVWG